MGENGEVLTTGVRFDIFTRAWNDDKREWEPSALKAIRDPDGRLRLNGVASSTIKDLHGDTMLLTALEDMERAVGNGLTIFGNHSYNVPEDVYGTTEHAKIKQAGTVDKNGDPIYDLPISIVINEENDRAVKTWKAIHGKNGNDGAKLGLSIGAMIPEGGFERDKKSGALTISHVELLETSIVGIPANPRSWVENAVKAFTTPVKKATTTNNLGNPQLTLDTDTGIYRIEGNLADVGMGESVNFGFGLTLDPTTSDDSDVVTAEVEIEIAASEESDGGGSQNDTSSNVTDPDVTDSKIRVIEIDTGDDSGSSSQGASQSEPAPTADEAVDEDATGTSEEVISSMDEIVTSAETVMASSDAEVTSAFQQLLDLTSGLTARLTASMEREREAIAAKAEAEQQRDEIVALSSNLIENTNAILNKLADQPVGRRTVFREARQQFEGLEGTYSSDFLNLLRSKKE